MNIIDQAKAIVAGTSLAITEVEICLAREVVDLHEALSLLRGLVKEGGVPRYTVTPGAALNSIIEEVVDPRLGR